MSITIIPTSQLYLIGLIYQIKFLKIRHLKINLIQDFHRVISIIPVLSCNGMSITVIPTTANKFGLLNAGMSPNGKLPNK